MISIFSPELRLNMKAACSYKTPVPTYETGRNNNTDNDSMNLQYSENPYTII
jgi:hypothetical protein